MAAGPVDSETLAPRTAVDAAPEAVELSWLVTVRWATLAADLGAILAGRSGLDGSSPLILRSVVALAHELGKEVVAEGVETQADAAYLRSIGCEYGQGYYYGEPMPPKDVADLLAALASHHKRRERERARTPAQPTGMEVQVGGAQPLGALPRPGTMPSPS